MEYYGVIHPRRREVLRLCRTELTGYARYYAFPSILRRDADTVLISFKDGVRHGSDPQGAQVRLCQAALDVRTQRITDMQTLYEQPDRIPQMGEYVRMPNGDICLYIDMQARTESAQRTGMEFRRSADGGRTYGPPQRFGIVDGVEYGYPFGACLREGRVYLLAMTFPNLQGSGERRRVHILSSDDNGFTWRFEADLHENLGLEFNESTLIPTQEGFALFTRGEAPRGAENAGSDFESPACLVMLDTAFRPLRMRDCRATRSDFSQVGRPRLYAYGGRLFLLTRQTVRTNEGWRMVLDLFAFDPETLEIAARFRLADPVADTQDGHYACLYLDETGMEPMLRVVDYETCPTPANPSVQRRPDIVQYSFHPADLEEQYREETGRALLL